MKAYKHHTVVALGLLTVLFGSCSKGKFHIKGAITEAQDSVLYLENLGINGVTKVDSAKLSADGTFDFDVERNAAPEFYQLRIGQRAINVSIDSTETVSVKAAYPSMWYQYEVEGSDNCAKIKELALMQMDLQGRVNALIQSPVLSADSTELAIRKAIVAYKEVVKRRFIFPTPMKASAYYALFQTVMVGQQPRLIFNPRESRDDVKVYGAVATSWDTYYPEAERGKNLHNIAIEGMKNQRIMDNNMREAEIDAAKIDQTGIIDLPLTDNRGELRSLTQLAGKVVLLDFHIFASNHSTQRIMALRSLYNKYHDRGLEIYQVSLDSDEHFWKTQTAALPWVSVRDYSGVSSSYLQATQGNLPCYFLIGRDNSVAKGPSQISNLEAAIESLL